MLSGKMCGYFYWDFYRDSTVEAFFADSNQWEFLTSATMWSVFFKGIFLEDLSHLLNPFRSWKTLLPSDRVRARRVSARLGTRPSSHRWATRARDASGAEGNCWDRRRFMSRTWIHGRGWGGSWAERGYGVAILDNIEQPFIGTWLRFMDEEQNFLHRIGRDPGLATMPRGARSSNSLGKNPPPTLSPIPQSRMQDGDLRSKYLSEGLGF